MHKFRIEEEHEDLRLDQFMTEFLKDYSRTQVQNFIDNKDILVNNSKVKSNYRLKEDDLITYKIEAKVTELLPIEMDLDIVYEDEYLLVVNKPAGLIVHPAPSTLDQETLVNGLLAYANKLSDLNGEFRPGIVHRLDKDTSGLLIVAKTNEAHAKLVEMLKERDITREYIALVHHVFNHKQALIDAPIGRDQRNRIKMAVTHINSKEAKTHISLEESFGDYSILKAKLDSGRTHQIRVHLKYIEHPIVGDKLYGYKNTVEMEGHALHSYKLEFIHPITNQNMKFEIGLPERINLVIENLRRQA